MGNCLKKESTAEWGGEESWEFVNKKPSQSAPAPSETESWRMRRRDNKCKKVRFDAHVEVIGGGYEEEATSKEGMVQVRIRISKKQLAELLEKVELQSLDVHEMMTFLINGGRQEDDDVQKAWRPVLKTIPEL